MRQHFEGLVSRDYALALLWEPPRGDTLLWPDAQRLVKALVDKLTTQPFSYPIPIF